MSKETNYKCETVLPYNEEEGKKVQISRMFDAISAQYDTMNRAMTFGVDLIWRKKAIEGIRKYKPQTILDVATGTGDFAIEAYKRLQPKQIVGVDISEGMLEVGREKLKNQSLDAVITLQTGDSMELAFADASFDAVTVAFGVRNFASLEQGCTEMCRVLTKGGHLVILEMSEPKGIYKPLYRMYINLFIPVIARLFSKDKRAYQYLPDSIEAFPQGEVMVALLKKCGFTSVIYKTFTFGVCSLYCAER